MNRGYNSFAFDALGNTYALFTPPYHLHVNHGGGIGKYNGNAWITLIPPVPVVYDIFYGIAVDLQNNLWVTTYSQIFKYDGINWTVYDHTNSPFTSNSFSGIAIDHNNDVWIGAENGELIRISQGIMSSYNSTNSNMPGNIGISSVTVDTRNNVWIGFIDFDGVYGASKFDGSTFTNFGIFNSGLSSSYVLNVKAFGNDIYFASDFGLTIFRSGLNTGINDYMNDSISLLVHSIMNGDKIEIVYQLSKPGIADLSIFNATGQLLYVKHLCSANQGNLELEGQQFSSGIYYCSLTSEWSAKTIKFIKL